jgi:hypothetical protein
MITQIKNQITQIRINHRDISAQVTRAQVHKDKGWRIKDKVTKNIGHKTRKKLIVFNLSYAGWPFDNPFDKQFESLTTHSGQAQDKSLRLPKSQQEDLLHSRNARLEAPPTLKLRWAVVRWSLGVSGLACLINERKLEWKITADRRPQTADSWERM